MGRYINWDDVTGRYIDAAKKAGDGAMGSYWLTGAEDEIDGYLAAKYTVPFSPAPGVVKELCIDLTYYKMTMQQPEAEPIWNYIDYRIKAIINGTIVLTTSGTALPQGTSAWSEGEGHHTSFGPDSPLDWHISSAWQDAVETQRDLG